MAPRMGDHTAYIVIQGPGHNDTRIALREGITSFGRLPSNDVILLGDLVSRHHARITEAGGAWTVEDLGARNGTYVNGARVQHSTQLKHEDEITIANNRIRVEARDATPEPRFPEGTAVTLIEVGGGSTSLTALRRGQPTRSGFSNSVRAAFLAAFKRIFSWRRERLWDGLLPTIGRISFWVGPFLLT